MRDLAAARRGAAAELRYVERLLAGEATALVGGLPCRMARPRNPATLEYLEAKRQKLRNLIEAIAAVSSPSHGLEAARREKDLEAVFAAIGPLAAKFFRELRAREPVQPGSVEQLPARSDVSLSGAGSGGGGGPPAAADSAPSPASAPPSLAPPDAANLAPRPRTPQPDDLTAPPSIKAEAPWWSLSRLRSASALAPEAIEAARIELILLDAMNGLREHLEGPHGRDVLEMCEELRLWTARFEGIRLRAERKQGPRDTGH